MKFSLPLISYVSVVCIALTACGGGSSDNKNNSSSKVAQTGSSKTASVAESSSDASSSMPAATVVLSGRVAIGAAIPNATVVARCADGSGFIAPVVTDINGGYQGTIPATASLPCALQARGGQPEVVLHSYATSAGNVNITVLTDLILAGASGQSPAAWFDSSDWQSVGEMLEATQNELARQLAQSGYTLDSETFSPFTVSFVIGDAHDQIMDRLQEAIAADGDLDSYEDLIEQIKSGEGLGVIPPVPASSSSSSSSAAQTSSVQTSLDDSPVPSSSSSLSSSAASSVASSTTVVVPAPSSVPASSVAPSSVPASSVAPSSVPASSSSVESSSVASSSTPASSSAASSSTPAWNLVWEDEFEGTSIDSSKWEHEVNCWGGGNNEAQCYVDSPANSFVDDGILNIKAIKGNVCGPEKNQEDPGYPGATVCKDYSSARLRTKGKGDWKYGRMEVRAKVPEGVGIWPAIWMLPTSTSIYGGWPHSGEIDIFEAFQPGITGPAPTGAANEIHGTLHYGFSWPWNQYSGADYVPPTNIWDDFYTYAVEWEEGEIRWYVNNVLFARNSNNWFIYYWGGQEVGYKVGTGAQPFDQPFHMILNIALGNGSYVPLPNFAGEKTMEVDYVRVYECSADTVTGKGCETPTANATVVAKDIVGHVPPADVREDVWLYRGSEGGIQTLTFDLDGDEVNNTLQHAVWNDSGALASNPGAEPIDNGSGGAVVWDLNYSNAGPAVAWLASADMTGVEGVLSGFNFGSDPLHNRARQLGEYKFDIWVESAAPGAKLSVKLGSGFPHISIDEVALTPDMVGKWTSVSVRFSTLRQAVGSWSQVDWSSVNNPFELEILGGAAHVQLDNIRISCLEDCAIKPKLAPDSLTEDFSLFENGATNGAEDYYLGQWSENGNPVVVGVAEAVDNEGGARGDVMDVLFDIPVNGVAFIQSLDYSGGGAGVVAYKDLSAFSGGKLKFDIYVADYGTSTGNLIIEIHSASGNGAGDIGRPAAGQWHSLELNIGPGGINPATLAQVQTPFLILPAWGGQGRGVHIQLDNVRWELPTP